MIASDEVGASYKILFNYRHDYSLRCPKSIPIYSFSFSTLSAGGAVLKELEVFLTSMNSVGTVHRVVYLIMFVLKNMFALLVNYEITRYVCTHQ